MLQDTTNEIQRFIGQIRVFVACKERLAVFPDRHVHMHAGAVITVDRLRHEGCRFAIGVGHIVDHIFVFLQLIGLFGQAVKDQAQLVLAGGHLVVVLVDLHPQTLHGGQHLGAQVLSFVDGVHREVAALDAGTVAHIAHLIFCVSVPGGVGCVDLKGHFVDGVGEAHIIKQEEFCFWPHIGHITDAGGLQIGLCLLRGAARVTRVGFAGVGFNHGAMDAEGLFGIKRIDIGGAGVEDQLHVGVFDRLPTCDGGTVEHEAFFDKVFVHQVDINGHVLELAPHISETDVDIGDVFVLDHLQNCVCAHFQWSF